LRMASAASKDSGQSNPMACMRKRLKRFDRQFVVPPIPPLISLFPFRFVLRQFQLIKIFLEPITVFVRVFRR
jgi:hypothetical protein